jgi:acetyl-CoA C-acetyltransferase
MATEINGEVYAVHPFMTDFGRFDDLDLVGLIRKTAMGGLKKVDLGDVDFFSISNVLGGNLVEEGKVGQGLISGMLAEIVPEFRYKPGGSYINACESGGLAFMDPATKILAGMGDVGFAMGVEKMCLLMPHPRKPDKMTVDSARVGNALSMAAHPDDRAGPFTFLKGFGTMMQKYLEAHREVKVEDFAFIVHQMYENASKFPGAHMYRPPFETTMDAILASPPSIPEGFPGSDLPQTRFMCSQISDGGASVLVCSPKGLEKLGIPKDQAVRLVGFGQAVDGLSIASRGPNLAAPVGARVAAEKAMKMAGIGPDDIDAAVLHDCFTVNMLVLLEALGLAKPGEGVHYFKDGHARVNGDGCTVNSLGGLEGHGHPISATGLAMIIEAMWQLLGIAPEGLGVENVDNVVVHNIGGIACSSLVTVFQRAVN